MKITFFPLALLLIMGGCATTTLSTAPTDSVPGPEVNRPGNNPPNPETIRVAIAVRQSSVHLTAPDDFVLSGFPWGTPVVQLGEKRYRETTLTSDRLYAHKAFIEPMGEGQIQVNGKSFRGSMEILEGSRGTLTVINQLPLEDHVMGVIAREMPRNWPLEALKAQAIAARTFAVLNRQEARLKGLPYDLENTALLDRKSTR